MSSQDHEFDTYFETLRKVLNTSSGRCKEIVIKIPDFLDLFIELMRDSENVGRKERKLLSASIAYVLVPYDVKPEKKKEEDESSFVLKRVPFWAKKPGTISRNTEGYIDDAFLCSEVLLRLREFLDEQLIKSKWTGQEDVLELAKEINEELKQKLNEETRENILNFTGL